MKFHKIKTKIEHKDNNWLPYTIATCSAVILFLLLNNIPEIYKGLEFFVRLFKPVWIGIVIAYLLNPMVKFFDRSLKPAIKHDDVRNGISIVLTSILLLVLLAVLMSFLIPQLIASIAQFVNNINSYSIAVQNLIWNFSEFAEAHNLDMEAITELFGKFMEKAAAFVSANAQTLLNKSFSIGGGAANFFIGLILAVYFLSSKRGIFKGFDRLCVNTMRPEKYTSMKSFLVRCNSICSAFIIQDMVDACIVGVVNFIFMSLCAMPYAVLISVIVAITNLAPTFGPFVGAFIGGFILLFADAHSAVIFLIFTLILQLLDGYVIKPKLFGGTIGVAGVWVTVGIIIGGKLFGVIGILVAVPLLGIMTFMYKDFIGQREQERLKEAAIEAQVEASIIREEPDFPDDI